MSTRTGTARPEQKTPRTVRELKAALDAMGVTYPSKSRKSELERAYRSARAPPASASLRPGGRATETKTRASAAAPVDESVDVTRGTHPPRVTSRGVAPPPPPQGRDEVHREAEAALPASKTATPTTGNGAPVYDSDEERLRWRELRRGLVVGDWVLYAYIARGSFGQVWKALPRSVVAALGGVPRPERAAKAFFIAAERTHAHERAAIKMIWMDPDLTGGLDPELLSETALQKHLRHPNVLSAREAFVHQGGTGDSKTGAGERFLAVVMPLERENCAQLLARWDTDRKTVGREADVARRLRLLRDVRDGVAYMAAMGFVHNDLKPPNILVGWDGTARIADPGLVRLAAGLKMGRTPDALVTVWWRSPELWCGYEAYGVASDMWSLGCIAYEIMLRVFPFWRDPVTGSPMMDIGERFGFPRSFRELLRAGPTDQRLLLQQASVFEADRKRVESGTTALVTREIIDRAFLLDANALGYWRTQLGPDVYRDLWSYLYDLLRVDPRDRRNDLAHSPRLFAGYPSRVPTPTADEVLVAHLSRTDAYSPALFPAVHAVTRSYAQFLWNRLNAEKSVPSDERRLWWQTTLALAAKLMDERAGNIPQLALEGRVELAIMAALDDPWRDYIVDPATERRKGRTYDYEHKGLVDYPFAPAPAAPPTTATFSLRARTETKRVEEKSPGGDGRDRGGGRAVARAAPPADDYDAFVEALIENYQAVVRRAARDLGLDVDEAGVRRIMWTSDDFNAFFGAALAEVLVADPEANRVVEPMRSDLAAAVRGVDGYARTVLLLTGKRETASYVAIGDLRRDDRGQNDYVVHLLWTPGGERRIVTRTVPLWDLAEWLAARTANPNGGAEPPSPTRALAEYTIRSYPRKALSRATVVDYVAGKSGSRTTDGEEKKEEEGEKDESQTADDFEGFFKSLDAHYERVTLETARVIHGFAATGDARRDAVQLRRYMWGGMRQNSETLVDSVRAILDTSGDPGERIDTTASVGASGRRPASGASKAVAANATEAVTTALASGALLTAKARDRSDFFVVVGDRHETECYAIKTEGQRLVSHTFGNADDAVAWMVAQGAGRGRLRAYEIDRFSRRRPLSRQAVLDYLAHAT